MKHFDLEAAKAGAKVQTASGYPVNILLFDMKSTYPIVALVQESTEEKVRTYTLEGREFTDFESTADLVMVPVVKYKVTLEVEFASLAEAQYYCAQFTHPLKITEVVE